MDTFPIQNYKHEYAFRSCKRRGGISFYIRNNIPYTSRDDYTLDKITFESIFIEIKMTTKYIQIQEKT